MQLNKNSKIVIFGGLGFIGENFVKLLKKENFTNIHLVEKDIQEGSKKRETFKELISGLNIINSENDILEESELNELLKDAHIILNFTFPKDFDLQLDKQILEYCAKHNKECKHIFMGSASQYDNSNTHYSETSPLKAKNSYGETKNILEKTYKEYHNKHNLPIIFIRASNIYGHSKNFYYKKTIDSYIFNGIKEGKIKIDLPENTFKDMIYIDDLTNALLTLLQIDESIGEIFNIGSGKKTTIKEIIELIKKHYPNVKIEHNPQKDETENSFVFDISKITTITNWKPKTSFEEGFKKISKKLFQLRE